MRRFTVTYERELVVEIEDKYFDNDEDLMECLEKDSFIQDSIEKVTVREENGNSNFEWEGVGLV